MYNEYTNNDCNEENNEVTEEQCETNDIGIVAVANAPYNIHCLTVIGQIVIIDSELFSTIIFVKTTIPSLKHDGIVVYEATKPE